MNDTDKKAKDSSAAKGTGGADAWFGQAAPARPSRLESMTWMVWVIPPDTREGHSGQSGHSHSFTGEIGAFLKRVSLALFLGTNVANQIAGGAAFHFVGGRS